MCDGFEKQLTANEKLVPKIVLGNDQHNRR